MSYKKVLFKACCLIWAASLVGACSDIADDEHYATPSWLKGNAWKVMEKEGNYSTFLKGIELAGFDEIVKGKKILTVMAADDQAWQQFLSNNGFSSIEDMAEKDPQLLKNTIGFHLMYYSYDWQKMLNFRPTGGDGATEESKMTNAGCYYKHRTHATDPYEKVLVPTISEDNPITILHYDRLLPVLSSKLFEFKGIDAKYNYEYFFPQTTWTGGDETFCIANANVEPNGMVNTDNGYIYKVSQVIKPLETIYQTLKQNPKYSDFIGLYDTYMTYVKASTTENENLGYEAYTRQHGELPPIALEWPVRGADVATYQDMQVLEHDGYNIFAPSNTAIANFFTNYWTEGCGYESLSDLDPLILQYFIRQSFSDENFIVFPEEIKKGLVKTYYGTEVNIDPDQVTDRLLCENGVVYGMDHMEAPAIFGSVIGPAFKDINYKNYLYTLYGAGDRTILSLASDETQFATLIPDNMQYENCDPAMRLYEGVLQEMSAETGDWVPMGSTRKQNIVNFHTAANVSELKASGTQVVTTTLSPFDYWYVYDGKLTTSTLFNQLLAPEYTEDPFFNFTEIKNNGQAWSNGHAYSYDNEALLLAEHDDKLADLLAKSNDQRHEYYVFAQLLKMSGVVADEMLTVSYTGSRTLAFVPTNDVLRANITKIPGCANLTVAADNTISGTVSNQQALADYLKQYFVTELMNATFDGYPYPQSPLKGSFTTEAFNTMTITNGAVPTIKVNTGNGAEISLNSKYHYLPFAFTDGCMQFIDGIIE